MGGILSSRTKVSTKADTYVAKEPLIKDISNQEYPVLTKQPEPVQAAQPVKSVQAKSAQKVHPVLTKGICVDTYWKNLPPPNCNVYWLYSSHVGDDYYFMSAIDSNKLESSYQRGKDSSSISAVGARVNFVQGSQISNCGGINRNVRRLSKQQYDDIQKEYKAYFNERSVLWCLKCKKHYLLYSPKYQRELDIAFQNGSILNVKVNDKYSYKIDARYYKQENTSTGKIREMSRVYPSCNDMVIYGSHFLKYDRAEAPSIMEQSNIYSAFV